MLLKTPSIAARALGIASAAGAVIALLAGLIPPATAAALFCVSLAVLQSKTGVRRLLSLAALVIGVVAHPHFSFLASIAAILAGAAGMTEYRIPAKTLAISAGFIGLFGVVAWGYGAAVPIRPTSALLFVMWSIAMLARTARDSRWKLTLRVAVISLVVPIALCGIAYAFLRAGRIDMPVAVTLMATGTGIVLVLSVLRLLERALASEMRYRTIVETSQDGIATLDVAGAITFVNARFAAMTGRPAEELIGRRAAEILENLHVSRAHDELRLRRPDGTSIDALVSCSSMRATDGGERGTLLMLTDITARKQGETALRISEARFRTLSDSNILGVCFWNFDGSVTDANDLFLQTFGLTRETLPQWTWRSQNIEDEVLTKLAEHGRIAPYIHESTRVDGTKFHALVTAARIEETPEANITFVLDVTDRVEAREALERAHAILAERVSALEGAEAASRDDVEQLALRLTSANRELETFSYSVSHDLRTPLRAIDGFSRILHEDYGDRLDAIGRNHLTRIRVATTRMSRLIDDLLNLSRLGRASLRRERVDVSALALEVARDRGAPNVRVDPGLTADADPSLLRVVLENLIGNAVKFSSRMPEPLVEIIRDNGGGTFAVRDNGTGFDMAYADKIFAPFERLHSAEFEGTGIGLALVQRIIHRHGGTIRAASTPGQGATFFVSFRKHPA
jgi:PAS domain S-box-containing protein